jgi:bacterioferritin-associated ferredoxin
MNKSQLIRTIKAHIEEGDKAAEKSEQHYIAAGQHLKTLKAEHGGTWAEWEELLKSKIGIGKSRASELMQIADGRKTVERVRSETAERTAKMRALQSSPLRSGENDIADDNLAQPSKAPPRCTFCRKCHHHTQLLIVATDGVHSICAECVDLYTDIVREHREKVARVNSAVPAEPPPASSGEGIAHAPETSAEAMKAKFAVNDDGLDIPEYLRRVPKATA